MTARIGFGRQQHQDPRSLNFLVAAHPKAVASPTPRSYTWGLPTSQMRAQGDTPRCVGYTCAHEIAARPSVHTISASAGDEMYVRVQAIDRREGRYWEEGASILAGVKALREMGFVLDFRWALSVEELAVGVSRIGPALLGVDWTEDMMEPDPDGYIWPTGEEIGGHAVLDRGYRMASKKLRWPQHGGRHLIQNSWGLEWGGRGGAPPGCAFITDEALRMLLSRPYADACIPTIRSTPR